jgi:hypothetical protein
VYSEFKISRVKSSISENLGVATEIEIRQGLNFILKHFAAMDFPRKISTKTTEGRQILVNDKPQALARFKQANYLDCRISAYTELDDSPNFLFVDIDIKNDLKHVLKSISRFKGINAKPTVLFTGNGYHIYLPIESVQLEKIADFANYVEPSKQFLRFAARYLSNGLSDSSHNPSFKSCMVRVPGSINSKNGEHVKIVQQWDGNRPDILMLMGSFYAHLATKQKTEKELAKINSKFPKRNNSGIKWIESLLSTPLDDYRKTIVNLVLAPYLINIRRLQRDESYTIIKSWLELCSARRKLDFNPGHLINAALANVRKTNYKPMRLDTLKARNFAIYERLGLK